MRVAYQIGTTLAITAIFVLGFQNCGTYHDSQEAAANISAKALSEEVSSLYENIQSLNRSDQSCVVDADCDSLAIGSKACGGPTGYLSVSKLHPNLAEIVSLAVELEQKEDQLNRVSGNISTCDYEMPPQVRCVESVCRAESAEAGLPERSD